MGCAICGALSDFHLKEDFAYTWGIIFFLSLLLWLPWLFDSNPANKTISYGVIRRTLWYIGMYFANVLLLFGFICLFLPSVYTSNFGEPFENIGKVTKMSDSYHRRSCDIRIHIDLFIGRICTSKDFYSLLRVGDEVLIEGKESNLGYKLHSIKRTQLTSKGSG